jgi:hypothetical protein
MQRSEAKTFQCVMRRRRDVVPVKRKPTRSHVMCRKRVAKAPSVRLAAMLVPVPFRLRNESASITPRTDTTIPPGASAKILCVRSQRRYATTTYTHEHAATQSNRKVIWYTRWRQFFLLSLPRLNFFFPTHGLGFRRSEKIFCEPRARPKVFRRPHRGWQLAKKTKTNIICVFQMECPFAHFLRFPHLVCLCVRKGR